MALRLGSHVSSVAGFAKKGEYSRTVTLKVDGCGWWLPSWSCQRWQDWFEVIRGCIYYFKMLGVHMWKFWNLGFNSWYACFLILGHAAKMAVDTGVNSTQFDHLTTGAERAGKTWTVGDVRERQKSRYEYETSTCHESRDSSKLQQVEICWDETHPSPSGWMEELVGCQSHYW